MYKCRVCGKPLVSEEGRDYKTKTHIPFSSLSLIYTRERMGIERNKRTFLHKKVTVTLKLETVP